MARSKIGGASIPSKRKDSKFQWISYNGPNGRVRESSGTTDKRVAAKIRNERIRQVQNGTWTPIKPTSSSTVNAYAVKWMAKLEPRLSPKYAKDVRARMRKYTLPLMGHYALQSLRPRHCIEFIEKVAQIPRASRTQLLIIDEFRQMLKRAVIDEEIPATPFVIERNTKPQKLDADPEWRENSIYIPDEVEQLITSDLVPWDRRTLIALQFLGGMRFGEAAGRRWKDIDHHFKPLSRLLVATQYTGKRTKTKVTRKVPIHPVLLKMLAEWKLSGFSQFFGRHPEPDDYIIPSRHGTVRNANKGRKNLKLDLTKLGLRTKGRATHAGRRFFTTYCQAGGAQPHIVQLVTHGPGEKMIEAYTTMPWQTLCEAVLCLQIDVSKRATVQDIRSRSGSRSKNASRKSLK